MRTAHTTTLVVAPDLDDRIAAAFQDGISSEAVACLIKETEAAAIHSGDAAERARKRALDPALVSADVAAARGQMEDAVFRRERLHMAVQQLGDRLNDLREREENERRQQAYNKVRAERDALAEELARVYPSLVAQLTKLLARIEANDRTVEFVNNNGLPSGSGRLLVAELVARGLQGFVENSVEAPSIVGSVRLPAFQRSVREPFSWPRGR